MDLSVVIPHYGEPHDTLRLIESLMGQTIRGTVEIIVSDDASSVPFPEIEGITVVHRTSNGGFGSNVNTGVSVATGEWIIILNSDLTVPSSFLEEMYAAACEERSSTKSSDVVLAPHIMGHNGESQWVGRKFPLVRHHAWEWFTPVARFRSSKSWHFMVGHDLSCVIGQRSEPDWLMGACLMMPRKLYQKLEGMDESFFMNSEEVDFQYRASQLGVPRVFRGDIVIEHEGGGSSGDNLRRRQWVVDSRFIYNRKWGQGKHLAVTLRAVSILNYMFNVIRGLKNSEVDAKSILRTELKLLKGRS